MKRWLFGFNVLVGVAALASVVWCFHPWWPEGKAHRLGTWNFDALEFQVWQRKNSTFGEPFADGLFVRKIGEGWRVVCIDIQDIYSPAIRLEQMGKKIVVFKGGRMHGAFDMATGSFSMKDQTFPMGHIRTEPPGNWWLRQTAH